jgi:phospholipid/cholesterol/gamma-HCH transport system ATP-binding protein
MEKVERKLIIQVKDLVVRYGDATILDGVSFDVFEGEIFVILGGSGCGKSTLLRHIIGLEKPYSGSILIDGDDISKAHGAGQEKILRKIGTLFQSGALFGSMTLAQNISLLLQEYTNLDSDLVELLVQMKLGMVNLTGYENFLPSEISGGMKKRAGLARAMALDPTIVFCDEPSAGLDPITSAEIDNLIIQMNKSLGITFVVVTHELDSIFSIAHRVVMLDKSVKNIVASGDPVDLKNNSPLPFVRGFFNRRAGSAARG